MMEQVIIGVTPEMVLVFQVFGIPTTVQTVFKTVMKEESIVEE